MRAITDEHKALTMVLFNSTTELSKRGLEVLLKRINHENMPNKGG